jgi:beta-mannosidase
MAEGSARKVLSLDGKWAYVKDPDGLGEEHRYYSPSVSRENWGEMDIPVNWYNTEVGDYHGAIWFAREFTVPEGMNDREYILRFNAVDYIAEVWLNGVYLGKHEGFFAPFEFRVTDYLSDGTNTVVVKVDSPYDDTEYRHVPNPAIDELVSEPYRMKWPVDLKIVKGALIHFYHRPGWETQFGQDGNTGGIWQGVELIATGTLTIDRVKIYPKLVENNGVPDGTVLLAVDIDVYNANDKAVKAEIGLEAWGKNFQSTEEIKRSRDVVLTPGTNRVKLVHTVREPVFWWCWDHGLPNLYQMRVTAGTGKLQDEKLETFGIRELKVDEKGHWAKGSSLAV